MAVYQRYIFRSLAIAGFTAQWGLMMLNGNFLKWISTRLDGEFPSGSPLKPSFLGFWPLDFSLGLLVTFFGSLTIPSELPNLGPMLLLLDLVFALVVVNMMTLVEDRRNRKIGSLRYPALWQSLNNSLGAASILPIYMERYLKRQPKALFPLPDAQADALPFSAVWSIAISLPVFICPMAGATAIRTQDAIVLWFLLPLTLGVFQDLVSHAMPSIRVGRQATNPVKVAYAIVGTVSAVIHVGVCFWAVFNPDLSLTSIYWPNHASVQQERFRFTAAAVLFTQYDFPIIYFSLIATGYYIFNSREAPSGIKSNSTSLFATLIVISAAFGPGAGLAWLLCHKETLQEAERTVSS
ncbi:hypothetical protein N7447_009520 [Penicillium robsamsonii]|uniref:uncharacterized protein n=1 Tax=Penicillium robsamsonii TaxID=1792511 RepID=UPI002549035C|nr:uncharacterized protein N7447_009520 [Penicillium robsamsonii]KAJ5817287.1 hypothetical protein N7447_009520 [Penicillium robsamsonii]